MEFKLNLSWSFAGSEGQNAIEPLLIDLLRAISEGGHLNYAASEMQVAYRHAWGLIRTWESRFGQPLLRTQRGRGAELTQFAIELLDTFEQTASHHTDVLNQAATSASARLSAAANDMHGAVAICSSHSDAIQQLREHIGKEFRITLELAGTEQALQRFRRSDTDLAGFHLPMGELGRTVAAPLINLLDSHRDEFRLVEERTLGLISRPDKPCLSLEQLADAQLQFVNRQTGSGTRLSLDGLLASKGINQSDIVGYETEEYTHTAVAALVASAGVDVAFGTHRAASQFKLKFVPLVEERFYLAMRKNADSRLKHLVDEFSNQLIFDRPELMKQDERTPTVAALKRIHNAGFWKGR